MNKKTVEPATAQEDVVYDRSFTARIAQADETVRAYYNEIKAELLSYKGVKSRMSWTADSFNKGRNKCAKMQIKGKTLVLYLALDPETLEQKYRVKNVSTVAKYEQVPTELRLRNPRSFKYAKELIERLMADMGGTKATHATEFEPIPAMDTEALINAGYIKCKKGSRPDFWGKSGD